MKNLKIKLGPVYSRLAQEEGTRSLELTLLPEHLHKGLRRHQAQTWKAYKDPAVDVIFDTAITGDGKSLAGQLPMYADEAKALLLYPTNELIRDQLKQVQRYMHDFGMSLPYQMMDSEHITEELGSISAGTRSSIAMNWFKNRHCVLSNPDLFHLMSSYNYGHANEQKELVYDIPQEFDYFIFDEFHIFGPPQIVWIINIMNYHKIAYPDRRLKYIFLSATPTPLFQSLLRNSGFNVHFVEGSYSPIPAIGYTTEPIVQPITLHVQSLSERGAYAWAEEHLNELLDFYQNNPTAKGVFIVNSVATAKRLVAYYRQELQEKYGIYVGENTGLTKPEERLEAMDDPKIQLIIATSTVDVGVDFKINLLIFESLGVGTFIQRLGRLGRHKNVGWNEYRAYALLPDWTVERFTERFGDDADIERVIFLKMIREQEEFITIKDGVTTIKPIFRPDQEYRRYTGCWGGLQAAHMIVQTRDIGRQYGEFPRELQQQYNAVYQHAKNKDWIGSQVARYKALKEHKYDSLLIKELNTFRGRSPLDCGIFDKTDNSFKTYNLFFLLANTRFHPIGEEQFKHMVEERQQSFERYRSYTLKLYVILERYVEEREQFNLSCHYSFKGKLNQVHMYDTFSIQDSRIIAAHLENSVNDQLSEQKLVCLVAAGKPADFKRENHLPPLFPVYQVRDKDNMQRSIVFGLDAFLAHSLVSWKTVKDDDCDELFIC